MHTAMRLKDAPRRASLIVMDLRDPDAGVTVIPSHDCPLA